MSLTLSTSEQSELNRLWKDWQDSDNLELEATFPVKTYVDYMHIVQYLQSIGLRAEPAPAKLNIILNGGVRISIVGDAQIQAFYETSKLTEYHAIIKQHYGTKEIPDSITLEEYDVRVKVRREIEIERYDPRMKAALAGWATSEKTFRYMKRFSFTSNNNPGIQFDATVVRQNKRPAKSLQESNVMNLPDHYEVEVEALKNVAKSRGLTGFLMGVARVLQGLQQSYVILPKSVSQSVLRAIGDFPGAQPATLMMEHIAMEKTAGTPNIRLDDYNVTDKADGDRCLLYVAEDGRIYLMDKDQNVYGTDRSAPEAVGVLLDGEWIHHNAKGEFVNYYYAFDIYNGRKGVDTTNRPFFTRVADAETRLNEMQEVIAILRDAAFVVKGIPAYKSLQISMKLFQPAGAAGIFAEAKSVLERVDPPYHTDGLIFTPNASPLPRGKGSWAAQLKWKPAEENTIDFLVKMEPNAVMKTDGDTLVLCKVLHLYVGSTEEIQFRDARATILQEDSISSPERSEKKIYRPVEFISDPYDPYASICYIPVEDGNVYTNRTKDMIPDQSIVEMAYHPERSVGFRWEPTRVRWDKTSRYQHGTFGRTFNNDKTAASVWTSIHEPITQEIISTGLLFSKKEMIDMVKLYYKVSLSASDTMFTKGLQHFHNRYIKDKILLQSTIKSFKDCKLLDMSCGKGGDLDKWIHHGAQFVLGCDIAESGLTDPRDNIYRRYIEKIQARGGRDRVAPMIFVQADASKLYVDGTAGMTPEDRGILRALWGNIEATVPPLVQRYKGIASQGFDVVSIMFSLHYMFQTRSMLDGWLMNLASCLKVDGYFIGCCFDGDAVANKLKPVPEGSVLSGTQKDTTVWSIRKQYDDGYSGYLPPTEEGIGRAIDVYFASIGEEHTEYLVSFPYLTKRLHEIGCELLTKDECRAIGLQNSTAMFETSHKMASDHGETYPMLPVVQEYSYLHRWFIFKRKTASMKAPITTGTPPAILTRPVEEEAPADVILRQSSPEELIELDVPVAETATGTPPSLMIRPAEGVVSPELMTSPPPDLPDLPETLSLAEEVRPVKGPILKFYEKSVKRDDLKIKQPEWAKILSTAAAYPFQDRSDASIVYPNLEAALTAEKYKIASTKPEIAKTLVGISDLTDIRKLAKDIKKHGYDTAKWEAQKESLLHEYLLQRFEEDVEFQRILQAVADQDVRLVFYPGPTSTNELGALVKGDAIEGDNLYGKALMALVGTTY